MQENVFFWSQWWLWFPIWLYKTLYYKMQLTLLQNATAILLQNATKTYQKMSHLFYYNRQQLLQNVTILLEKATVPTKYDVITKCISTFNLSFFLQICLLCLLY